MEREIIKASIGAKYLSEFMEDLPHDCLFNKVITGAGGTTIALTNKENYIVCSPFVSLIENKCHQHKNVLGVYGKFKVNDIKRYLKDDSIPVKKIMVTYDSLPRLMTVLDPKEYRLLIDELHLLFQSIIFRNTAVNGVLDNFTKFKSYTFMTATMLEEEFILKELSNIKIVEVEWDNTREVTVKSIKCKNDVIHATAEMINGFLDGSTSGNAHIFVNSVLFMKDMIKICKLNDSNAKAVYAESNLTHVGLLKSKTTDTVKKINFYSSTSFQGVDVYDLYGKIFIISDKSRSHSLLDISTSFMQIVNRIRNTKYWDTITHIFTNTRYDIDLDYNQFKAHVEKEIEGDLKTVEEFNLLSARSQSKIKPTFTFKSIDKADNSSYIIYDGEKFDYDENLMKFDLFNFKVTKHLYKLRINLTQEYENYGFIVEETENDIRIKNIAKISPTETFRETVIECKKNDKDFYLWAISKYNFLEAALNLIGYDGIENMEYHMNNIRKKVISLSNKSLKEKVNKLIKTSSKFVEGKFYSNEYVKDVIKDYYEQVGITENPTSSAIKDFLGVKVTSKRFETKDGNGTLKVDGFLVLKV